MRRRELIWILGGATAVWPFSVYAQKSEPVVATAPLSSLMTSPRGRLIASPRGSGQAIVTA